MKHNLKITAILLAMFVITQLIGIYVISADPFTVKQEVNGTIQSVDNPYLSWINPPEAETTEESAGIFVSVIIAFVLAITILVLLMKFRISIFLKIWFFVVITVALALALMAFAKLLPWNLDTKTIFVLSFSIALLLAALKLFGRNFFIHNATEFLIYPGIAAVFIPILIWKTAPLQFLKPLPIIVLLILISVYDIWAVWHSGIMQKMAKYQINKLRIFSGFFVPYVSKQVKKRIKKMKKNLSKSQLAKKKIGVNVAILGGGDIVFPIIAAGIMLKTLGLGPALLVTAGATLGLGYLFFAAEKKKFYPAMPFITAGIFLGILASYLIW